MMMTLVVGTKLPLVRSFGSFERQGEPFGELHPTLGSSVGGWFLAENRAEEVAVDVCPGYTRLFPNGPAQGAKLGTSRKRVLGPKPFTVTGR